MNDTPISLVPLVVPGETIVSYLARLAAHNYAPLGWATHATGLAATAAHKDQPTGLIVTVTPAQAAALEHTTGIPAADWHQMTFASWVGSVVDPLPLTRTGAVDNRVFARSNWTRPRGTPYCPQCVTESNGAYLLAWRNPLTTVCLAHECLLVAACPRCDKAPQDGHGDGTLRSGFLTVVPTPGTCTNTLNLSGAVPGAGSKPCGYPLMDTPMDTAPNDLLQLQTRLNQRLDSTPENRAFWTDMRALVAVILNIGTLSASGTLCGVPIPQELHAEWEAHQTDRDGRRADTTLMNTVLDRDHRQGERNRYWLTTPTNPTLIAAAVHVAEQALTDDDTLHSICTTVRGTGRSNGLSTLASSRPTNDLLTRARTVVAAHGGTTTRTGFHSRRAVPSPIAHLAANIPSLLWDDVYTDRFEAMLEDVRAHRGTLRRLCSVALHKHLTGNSWEETATHFADQLYRNPRIANATLDRMKNTRDGLHDQFLDTVAVLVAELEADPSRLAGE